MKNFYHVISDLNTLQRFLASPEICAASSAAKSSLVQIYSSQTSTTYIENIVDTISAVLPDAVIVGSTTVGEIAEGRLLIGTTILSIVFFETVTIKSFAATCAHGNEGETGRRMMRYIEKEGKDIAGVLLLGTPLSINMAEVFNGMAEHGLPFPFFGGGAGIYDNTENSMVFFEKDFLCAGLIAVVLISPDLEILVQHSLGWKPLSKEMTITDVSGMLVRTIDEVPAFDVYQKYFDIQNDKDFFSNVLEFPLLIDRDGTTLARVPFFVFQKGTIEFDGDIRAGEKCRIGYGDPETIIRDAMSLQEELRRFDPDVIFLFSCICRRFLMQENVNLEISPFEQIAPTTGFFTYGEFYNEKDRLLLQNATIVAVGMRENGIDSAHNRCRCNAFDDLLMAEEDPFANKHNRIVSRLLHFIGVITSELEDANRELLRISGIDKLTQLFNRLKLDDFIQKEINKSSRYQTFFSVILGDIDHFKKVNDTYGHLVGDEVLIKTAALLQENVRDTDVVGRWGGEEFLMILPQTDLAQAHCAAEKIRLAIEAHEFPQVGHLTCSFGVASFSDSDTQVKLLNRADKALYLAKSEGRNRVISMESEESNTILTEQLSCER